MQHNVMMAVKRNRIMATISVSFILYIYAKNSVMKYMIDNLSRFGH